MYKTKILPNGVHNETDHKFDSTSTIFGLSEPQILEMIRLSIIGSIMLSRHNLTIIRGADFAFSSLEA